jgi:DNA-binding HxlR family transcriptional regulator
MKVGDERFRRGLYDLKYLFGDKWVPAILVTLSDGPMRRKEILSTIRSYSIGEEWSDKHTVLHDSILARTLKKMTEEGILTRRRDVENFPPRVYYSLKEEVVEFLELAMPLIAWTEAHPDLITRAQAYSRRHADGAGHVDDLDLSDEDDEPEDSRPLPH